MKVDYGIWRIYCTHGFSLFHIEAAPEPALAHPENDLFRIDYSQPLLCHIWFYSSKGLLRAFSKRFYSFVFLHLKKIPSCFLCNFITSSSDFSLPDSNFLLVFVVSFWLSPVCSDTFPVSHFSRYSFSCSLLDTLYMPTWFTRKVSWQCVICFTDFVCFL